MSSNGKPPSGWQEYRLCEVADVRFSSVDKNIHEGQRTVLLCNYMDVWKNPYIHRDLPFMEGTASDDEFDKFSLRLGDVLLTKDSETRDEIAEPSVVHEQIENLVLGYHLALIRPKESLASGPFLAAQLRIPQFRRQFIKGASGVTRYGLGLDTVRNAIVWLPTPLVQRHIATIIRAVDEAIEATRAVIEQTRRLTSGIQGQLLSRGIGHTQFRKTRIGPVPKDWNIDTVGSLCEFSSGTGFSHSDWSSRGLPIIRIQNLNGSTEFNYYEGEPDPRWIVEPGELLFAWAGVKGVSFGPCIWPGPRGLLNQHIYRIRPNNGVDRRWLYAILGEVTHRIEAKAHGFKTSLVHVHKADITDQLVAVPPAEEQVEIARRVEDLELWVTSQEEYLKQLEAMKSAVSQGLLTGRIPVKGGR